MRSDHTPHSPSQGEGGNRRKTAYAGGEHVKDSSEHLKRSKRGTYAAADADKGIGTDARRCLKRQKRERYAVADAGKGIEPDAKGCECLHS